MNAHKFVVTGLSEYYKTISNIANQSGLTAGCPLWFRGQAYAHYNLIPSIMRKDDKNDNINSNTTYNTENLREDCRLQNYKARVFHLTSDKPSSRLEWQALYQHNKGKTRLMDWSESARTALSFALESFIDPRELKHLIEERKTITPTVWILDPRKLNNKVFEYFGNDRNRDVVAKALQSIGLSGKSADLIKEMSCFNHYFSYNAQTLDDIEIDGIFNLGVIDEQRYTHASELKNMLEKNEFNPFFYLCLKYYVDALPVEVNNMKNMLPPLAILHQYQSERIRAQRGVFTVFPNYDLSDNIKRIKKIGYDCRMLENQQSIRDCLYEIRILNPNEVAKELLFSGERQTELYPENEFYVHTMEANKFFV